MDNSGGFTASLSGRYARSLFELAVENKALDSVNASLATLKAALAESDDIRALIGNPMLNRTDAAKAMAALAKMLKLDTLTTNFLGVLAQNKRLAALSAIITSVEGMADTLRGEMTADVTTAHPLDSAQSKALTAKLKARLGKDVSIRARVNPEILGGLIVKIGSQMIDDSIATKLNTLALAMKG
ncbi:MAG: F0F1 ATP synthase subunit delta [Alphaproteobacteria bacterium]|nr:F0F1 ATP synthase subunit delta [Alphaproteobacteria bacterium]MDE2041627.1 F0F1 ATP synthase subunit delta [Alphaproteobacteria bacterium]MDE2339718.1 F0F1 ATP synthase subunit delta [Alphaproteobacteria bacterium]